MSDETKIMYCEDGAKVELVASAGTRFIVRDVVSDEYGDYISDHEHVVQKLYKKPPTQIFDAKIEKLKKEIDLLSNQSLRMRQDFREEQSKFSSACKTIETHCESLCRFSDFITTGDIVIIKSDYMPEIYDTKNAECVQVCHEIGKRKGDSTWVKVYKENYSSSFKAILCRPDEKDVVLKSLWAAYLERVDPVMRTVRLADEAGITVPVAFRAAAEKKDADEKAKKIARLEAELNAFS